MTNQSLTRILFICMGNICRSPAAEAVFLKKVHNRNLDHLFDVDSAGTGAWHTGNQADPRSREEGANRGYDLLSRARQIKTADSDAFDLIICMDEDNRQNALSLGIPSTKIRLLSDWHPDSHQNDIPDPYYGGQDGFVFMYDLIEIACERLIDDIIN